MKEPWIRVVKKAELGKRETLILRLEAIVLALVAGGFFILLIGQNQGAGQQRLSQLLQQHLANRVAGNAQANGFLFRMHQAARHFAGGRQNKGGNGRGIVFQQAVHGIVHFGIGGNIR